MSILIHFEELDQKSPSPFKFNHAWLQDKSFLALLENIWRKFDCDASSSAMYLFLDNLVRPTKLTILWEKEK